MRDFNVQELDISCEQVFLIVSLHSTSFANATKSSKGGAHILLCVIYTCFSKVVKVTTTV